MDGDHLVIGEHKLTSRLIIGTGGAANLAVVERATEAYQAALQLGKG